MNLPSVTRLRSFVARDSSEVHKVGQDGEFVLDPFPREIRLGTMNWRFWIDVGGTFTDCIARRPDGTLATHKLLSLALYKGLVHQGSDRTTILDPGRSD